MPPGDGPLAFELRWKRSFGSGYSGISLTEGHLITAMAGGERDWVVSLDPSTGSERWRYDLAPTHKGHDGSHDGPISTPAIADGRVFAVSPGGQVAAIDLETGESIWTVHLVEDLGCEQPFYDFGSSPLVVGSTMILQIGGKAGAVAGFAVTTGEILWRALDDDVGTQSPILAEMAGTRQVLVMGTDKVAGLDPVDGSILWQFDHLAGPGISLFSSPLPLQGDRVLLQNKRDATTILHVRHEGPHWVPSLLRTMLGMSKSYSPPTQSGQTLFGYTGRLFTALDLSSGELLWRSRQPGDGFVVTTDKHLVILTKKGGLHLGAASPQRWHEMARLDLFEDVAWTPPSVVAGTVFARSLGEIARVDVVRAAELVAERERNELPAALKGLATEIAASENPDRAVDTFLEDRTLPLIDNNQVIFLWRGEAEDVAVAGDMLGMRREEPMRRLAGTDLWWWQTRMDRRAPAKYLFFVDYRPTLDPSHDRVTHSTILGPDMNWRRGESVEMSWFAMPEWPGWELTGGDSQDSQRSAGKLDSFELTLKQPPSADGEKPETVSVSIPVWLPPGYDTTDERYPVLYVNNHTARDLGRWPQALNRVVGRTAAPMIVVFLELGDISDEHLVLVREIVPAIDSHYRTLANRSHRGHVGMGWPGFGAGLTTFENPEIFGILGVQSFFALDEQMEMLRSALGDHDARTTPLRIYLEWGRWDLNSPLEGMDFRASSRQVWELLWEKGWEPIGGEVWDSTDWASWQNRTDVLLESLFPIDGVKSNLDRWQTSR